jgi:hypothetical protein
MSQSQSSPPAQPPAQRPAPPADVVSNYSTRPYPVAEDPAKIHHDQIVALVEKLERVRVALGSQLDSESLAVLQSAVVELAAMAGVPVPYAPVAPPPGAPPAHRPPPPSPPPGKAA